MRFPTATCRTMAGWRSHPKIQEAKRKGAPMWCVVQVETGREKTACDDIKQAAEDVLDECFVPQYLTGKRRPDGTWIPSKECLFPGYLICVTSQVDELADKLRRVRSLTKILGNDNAFIPLTEDEQAWVQKVIQKKPANRWGIRGLHGKRQAGDRGGPA